MGIQKIDKEFKKKLKDLDTYSSSAKDIDNAKNFQEQRSKRKNDDHLNILKASYKKYNYLSNVEHC